MRKSMLGFGMIVVLALGGSVFVVAPPASAVGCYGDYCSGLDPMATGCANDAKTVHSAYVPGTYGGTWVEIRWSPTCKTNWARSNNTVAFRNVKAVQKDTGYTQGYSSSNGVTSWSKMIYSPVMRVKGVIWGGWGTTETPWA